MNTGTQPLALLAHTEDQVDPLAIKYTDSPFIPTSIWMPGHITVWEPRLCFQLWHKEKNLLWSGQSPLALELQHHSMFRQSDYSNQKPSSSQITCRSHTTYIESDTVGICTVCQYYPQPYQPSVVRARALGPSPSRVLSFLTPVKL